MLTNPDRKDRIVHQYEAAIKIDAASGRTELEYLIDNWKPEEVPQAWMRYTYANSFLDKGMALLAFRHEKAPLAFQACERWANQCLEIADPEESIPQFMAYYTLAASSWFQAASVPQAHIDAIRLFATRSEALPDRYDLPTVARYSWGHALTGDWEHALHTINKLQGTRPVVLNSKGAMSPAQALAWAYQHMTSSGADEKHPERFVRALQNYVEGDGMLTYTIPWLYAYQAIFAPDTRPADLLYLLRPGAVPA